MVIPANREVDDVPLNDAALHGPSDFSLVSLTSTALPPTEEGPVEVKNTCQPLALLYGKSPD